MFSVFTVSDVASLCCCHVGTSAETILRLLQGPDQSRTEPDPIHTHTHTLSDLKKKPDVMLEETCEDKIFILTQATVLKKSPFPFLGFFLLLVEVL